MNYSRLHSEFCIHKLIITLSHHRCFSYKKLIRDSISYPHDPLLLSYLLSYQIWTSTIFSEPGKSGKDSGRTNSGLSWRIAVWVIQKPGRVNQTNMFAFWFWHVLISATGFWKQYSKCGKHLNFIGSSKIGQLGGCVKRGLQKMMNVQPAPFYLKKHASFCRCDTCVNKAVFPCLWGAIVDTLKCLYGNLPVCKFGKPSPYSRNGTSQKGECCRKSPTVEGQCRFTVPWRPCEWEWHSSCHRSLFMVKWWRKDDKTWLPYPFVNANGYWKQIFLIRRSSTNGCFFNIHECLAGGKEKRSWWNIYASTLRHIQSEASKISCNAPLVTRQFKMSVFMPWYPKRILDDDVRKHDIQPVEQKYRETKRNGLCPAEWKKGQKHSHSACSSVWWHPIVWWRRLFQRHYYHPQNVWDQECSKTPAS